MSVIKEFKEFALKGNVIDLAVGMVIGGAFTKIVTSMVDDIITPLILAPALKAANITNIQDFKILDTVKIGSFLSTIIAFVIIAFALFMVIKGINAAKKKEEAAPAAPPAPSKEEVLLGEIRDLLKK